MSATEEKGNNNDEETALNEDLVDLNTETRSVSDVQDVTPTVSSETIGAMSKIVPKSPSNITEEHIDKESGDNKVEKVTENIDKKNQEPHLDSGKGSGDHTATNQPDSSTIDIVTSLVEKNEESLMDVSADITDADEMELKWDDDDDDDDKSSVNDDILLEEQLLKEDTSNTEVSKNVVKDTENIDENVLEETDTNSKDKSETDEIRDNKEIGEIKSPLQEIENNEDTINIDRPVETKNNEEVAKVDTAESSNKDVEKMEDVILESSDTENVVLEVEKEVNKEISQEVDIKKIPDDSNTGDKFSTDIETKISDDDLNKDSDDDKQVKVDNPVTNKISEPEDVSMDDDDKMDDVCEVDDDDEDLKEKVINSPETKIPDLEMDVDDNIEDVNEEELLKDDENQVADDGPSIDDQDKTDDKNDEIQDKIDDNLLKDDEKQVVSDEIPSIKDQDKTSDELQKDNEKDDDDQDKIDEELLKDDENQVMDVDDAVADDHNKINDNTDEITTDLDIGKTLVDDQIKMDDNINQIPTNLNEVVNEKVDETPSTSLDVESSTKNIALDKFEKEILSEKEKANILDDKDTIDNETKEDNILTKDLAKETKIDDKKELSDITPKTPENIPVEEKADISNKLKNVEEAKITDNDNEKTDISNTVENLEEKITNNDNSKCIDLEDSPIHSKPHSLHKPDVMLEIPSQEFIDIDAELSINLDQLPASPEMTDNAKNIASFDDNIKGLVEQLEGRERKNSVVVVEKDSVVLDKDKKNIDGDVLDGKEKDDQIKETVVNKDEEIKDAVVLDKDNVKDTVIQETVEEGMERIFAEDPVVKDTECIATTSTANLLAPDTTDLQEMTDSLGLLAESVRVRDDEGDALDDDDDDHYESSNQVSPYQSDDSNAATESDAVRQEKEIDSPDVKENEFQFTISNVESTAEEKREMEVDNTVIDGAIDDKTKEEALLKNGEETNEEQIEESLDQEQQMDIDTVKLSDTSDSEKEQTELSQSQMKERDEKTPERDQKSPPTKPASQSSPFKQSPSIKKLEIKTLQPDQIVNIVDLQESSSSEDELHQPQETEDIPVSLPPSPSQSVTTVNIPSSIEVMASGGTTSEMVSKKGEIVVSGVPKPKPHPPARLNTSEVTIKTVSHAEPMVIPETKLSNLPPETQVKPKLGLEIFNLDSDEEDNVPKEEPQSPPQPTPDNNKPIKCMNYSCTSTKVPFIVADATVMAYYDAGRKRRNMVCQSCADAVYKRAQNLIEGIKEFTPLLDLQLGNHSHELVEISDSESEDDEEVEPASEGIGEKTAQFLEDNLANIFNETWKKYDLETRLKETQIMLEDEMDQIERDTKDLDKVFDDYQQATDTLRRELYATFQVQREELPPLTIVDKPGLKFIGQETYQVDPMLKVRADKRRKPTVNEQPAKRPAIPLGYAPLEDTTKDKIASKDEIKLDEDKDISVVRLSMELAPADLPPPGSISRPPLRVGMPVYAMKNAFGPWLKGRILEIQPRVANTPNSFSLCRVKFDHKTKTNAKILPARCVAYAEPSDVRMTIGTRLIALFKDSNKRESYYSGVVAEIPNPVNSYRYLVFFDDGYAQYVHHPFTRLVCESSPLVWEEVHPFSRDFVMEYLLKYPERPMVRLHEGQHLKTEWNGKWWPSRVSRVDASLAQVMFVGDGRREWIYRGSTRLAPLYLALRAAERHRPRPMPRSKAQPGSNMPYVEYTRSDEPEPTKQPETQAEQHTEEIRHQRAVAKKSTASHIPPPRPEVLKLNTSDAPTKDSRVVYYTPKNAVRPYKMSPHRCGPHCKRSDVLTLKELRTYNPLAKPLLSGWERQLVRFKGQREVMYRAPCGRRLRNMNELHHYLRLIDCELPVDLFDFNPMTHCLAEFVMSKCLVGKKDLSHGKENVPVPCVNFFDESLPEFCSYNTERTPTAGVPLNLDPEFLCGCDCTDDCADKEKCACWRMTLEGAKTIGLEGPSVGYVYKRLPEPLPSGIYECNSRCKCKDTCLNRVAQHPLQLKLQVFKTENRGWGIRALNDVPKGSFLCVYAGNLLTDATANLDGLNEGDEYLAELDYIEVVEQMKEGYEEDIPEADKKLDKKELKQDDDDDDESESSSSEEDDTASKTDKEDDDFRPGYIGLGVMEFNKRLRRRSSKKIKEEPAGEKSEKGEKDASDKSQEKKENADEDCITISDDEEVREPSSFTVKAGMGANDFVSKYRSVRSYFGEDEACYIMDAKVQGNIGRYLNHSCCPNVFVQNVFVDTHDPRFPWVAFFALSHIKAGTELTWNYNYDVGSVPGKVLYCYCDAPNCRGRLL